MVVEHSTESTVSTREHFTATAVATAFLVVLCIILFAEVSQGPDLEPHPACTQLDVATEYPIATSCSELSATCSSGCGPDAVFPNCVSQSAACTPFSFMPNVDDQNCEWMDSGRFTTSLFFNSKDSHTNQIYAAAGSIDRWVLHGCDGAGIQTDCAGDIGYLENFDSSAPVPEQQCTLGIYGKDHDHCPTFYHPGYQNSYPGYSCGWWRGYNTPTGIEAASVDGVGAFGPHGAGGNYSAGMRQALSNCETCAHGTGLVHPYAGTGALAYFVGAIWPWVCTADNISNPYTGSEANCYCDNEPWNGRGAGERDYPHHTQVVYCGLYDNRKMVCDFVNVGFGSASADFRAVEMSPALW